MSGVSSVSVSVLETADQQLTSAREDIQLRRPAEMRGVGCYTGEMKGAEPGKETAREQESNIEPVKS